jgi:hypothetical protein
MVRKDQHAGKKCRGCGDNFCSLLPIKLEDELHAVWLYACMGVWLYACMGVWLYACMGVREIHVHGALWARSVRALCALCFPDCANLCLAFGMGKPYFGLTAWAH